MTSYLPALSRWCQPSRTCSARRRSSPLPTGSSTAGRGEETGPIEGYLVGAYCIERELLTWRRMRFPQGVRVGDTVVFPNTAGYHMHILESASHQIPLARNVVVSLADDTLALDAIDA